MVLKPTQMVGEGEAETLIPKGGPMVKLMDALPIQVPEAPCTLYVVPTVGVAITVAPLVELSEVPGLQV